jgi:hypothetical protein
MNAEIRDHANFLKGALDLLTNSTTADTGTSMYLNLIGSTTGDPRVLATRRSGESGDRLKIGAYGSMVWANPAVSQLPSVQLNPAGYFGVLLLEDPAGTDSVSLRVDLAASPGYAPAFRVRFRGDSFDRLVVGSYTGNKPAIGMGDGTATPSLFLISDTPGRMLFTGVSGAGVNAKIGVVADNTTAATNSLFTWVQGDTQPRFAAGIDSSGRPQIAFGPGGATAPDAILYRSSASTISNDDGTIIRLLRSTTTNGGLAVKTTGDTFDRILLIAGGTIRTGDGTAAPVQVISTRVTGWGTPTGTLARTTFDTGTATLVQVANRLGALVTDLLGHGLIGA